MSIQQFDFFKSTDPAPERMVDIDLLQRWCGLALFGVNLAQRLVILTGTAGGGKGLGRA